MNLADRAVRIADHQTTEMQRDTVAEHVLVHLLSRAYTSPEGARDAIETAVAEGRLVEQDGRYALAE